MNYDVQDFDREVIEQSRTAPVMVDFWAPWCGPCKMLGPVLERLAQNASGKWTLVKVNTEEQPGLATAFNVSSIPNVKLFVNGVVADEFLGFRPEAEIQRWLERHLPSPATIRLEKAAEHIDNGEIAAARKLLEEALAEEPGRAAAKLLLGEILLGDEPARVQSLLDEIPPDADEAPHAEALKLLATVAQHSPDALPDDDLKAAWTRGLEGVRRRDWEAALSSITDIIERRRDYADGLAANAGKAIFRYLGVRHPIASNYYRRFSSAINA